MGNFKEKCYLWKIYIRIMHDILLKNITCNGALKDIFIDGDRIAAIRDTGTLNEEAKEQLDCTGRSAMPGFVNMHTHAAMSLMRGVGEDTAFHQWLAKVW